MEKTFRTLKRTSPLTDTGMVERRFLMPLLLSAIAVAGCGGRTSVTEAPSSRYQPPQRQHAALPDSLNIHGCSSTTMGGDVLVSICDPVLLQRAWKNGTLNQRGDLGVRIAGRKVRVASTPGLTQVVPDDGIGTLLVPAEVTLDGHASDGSYLYISARSEKPEHVAWGEGLFRHLGLARGGVAMLDAKLDDHGAVRFLLHRPDGSTLKPRRTSHLEGPGPQHALPPLPSGYADTPAQGTRTYVAAINARDGKTLCQLWTAERRQRFQDQRSPCWALATGLIDYGSESDSAIFERLELLGVGSQFERSSDGSHYTAVPISVRTHYRQSRYSTKQQVRDGQWIVWFRHTGEGWRIAKDPLFAPSEDPNAPPGPSTTTTTTTEQSQPPKPSPQELRRAAQRAMQDRRRAARERAQAQARLEATWAASLVDFSGPVSCHGHQVQVADPAGDVAQQSAGSASANLLPLADIRSARLAIAGRHVCVAVTFARQPFAERQRRLFLQLGLGLTYQARFSVPQYGFEFETNTMLRDGRTYAGLIASPPQPAATHAELNGNTLIIEFNVDRHFPSVRSSQLRKLTWGLDISLGRVGAVGSLHDQVPNNPHPEAATLPPGIRQSDGRIVKPS